MPRQKQEDRGSSGGIESEKKVAQQRQQAKEDLIKTKDIEREKEDVRDQKKPQQS